jgi:hypothetical protein
MSVPRSLLDDFLPAPRLVQIDHVDVAVPPDVAEAAVRALDLRGSPLVRALFALRSIPARLSGKDTGAHGPLTVASFAAAEGPGFRLLADVAGEGFVVGAIGRFWEPDIPFMVVDPATFATVDTPGMGKVAWSITFAPRGEHDTRIVMELRVDATDDDAWSSQCRYFRLIGPFSHFMRRHLLAMLAKDLGDPAAAIEDRALPGDDLIPDARAQMTHGIDIAAPPSAIWPWLVQMGCDRGGWYSWDRLDNAGRPSAVEIRPELQRIEVGDVLPARPGHREGFTVHAIDPERALVLGGTFDLDTEASGPVDMPTPPRFWRTSWAFVLEPLDGATTRLHVRARVDFDTGRTGVRTLWMRPIHHFMQTEQLRNLARRAEGRQPLAHDTWRDVAEGMFGAFAMVLGLVTPFLRGHRNRWGLDRELAERIHPGDDLVPHPKWSWTHAVEIDAPPEAVWPWVAQIGQGRGGFYSYQWLENLAGCDIQNAAEIDPRWQDPKVGDGIALHRDLPPLPIAAMEPGRWIVGHGRMDGGEGRFADVSWLFLVEPRPDGRTRLVSRFRSDYDDALASRLQYGPTFVEPVGFVMDRRMLLGIKARVEDRASRATQ